MRRILSAADARNRLADALRQAESSDLVLITRYRKPVAALQPSDMYGSIYHLSSAGTLKKTHFLVDSLQSWLQAESPRHRPLTYQNQDLVRSRARRSLRSESAVTYERKKITSSILAKTGF